MVWTATGKKEAAGNAAHQQGDECVEGAGVPATPPSSIGQRCRGHRLRTAKKKGVFPEHPNDHLGFSDRLIGCFIHRGNDTPVLRRVESHVSADGRLMQPWSRTLADSSKLEH